MRQLLIVGVRFYQKYISRWTPSVCRFTPSCSEYAVQALERYGAIRGCGLALARIFRCHPFHPGGHDPLR